jgi:hypothetical protein
MSESDKARYVVIRPRLRTELEQLLSSGDPNNICDALFSAAQHEADWRWSQEQCLKMLNHAIPLVRSCALIALGEIALFRGQLDLTRVLPELKRLENDPTLGSYVEDALVNLETAGLIQHEK